MCNEAKKTLHVTFIVISKKRRVFGGEVFACRGTNQFWLLPGYRPFCPHSKLWLHKRPRRGSSWSRSEPGNIKRINKHQVQILAWKLFCKFPFLSIYLHVYFLLPCICIFFFCNLCSPFLAIYLFLFCLESDPSTFSLIIFIFSIFLFSLSFFSFLYWSSKLMER